MSFEEDDSGIFMLWIKFCLGKICVLLWSIFYDENGYFINI